jgi:hypothetical protein
MDNIYDHAYYGKHLFYDATEIGKGLNRWRAELVHRYLCPCGDSIIGAMTQLPGPVIDWGCGGAGFMNAYAMMDNRRVIGVDVNPYCVFHAVADGFKAFTPEMFEYFLDGSHLVSDYAPAKGTDAKPLRALVKRPLNITFWDVFEHLQDPRGFLKRLQPAMLFISLPCLDGFRRAFGKDADIQLWKHYRPQEHLWSFDEVTLREFLNSCGYDTLEVTHGESAFRVDPVLGELNIMTFVAKRREA